MGLISGDDATDLRSAISDAPHPTKPAIGVQETVDGLGLPAALSQPLSGGLADLNTISSGALSAPASGPLSKAGAVVAKYCAPIAAGITGLHGGDLAPAMEAGAALLGVGHRPVSTAGGEIGALANHALGTRVDPGQAITDAATTTLGGAAPGALSTDQLAAVQSAYRDAQAQAASDAQDAAAQVTKAKQTDASWKTFTAGQNAVEDPWQRAMAQRDWQVAAGQPDPLSAVLWQQAQADAPNLTAVTASQVRGFNASPAAAGMATQGSAADSAALGQQLADEARGTNLNEQAGAWLERQLMRGAKAANPGVPITGASALAATDPQALFEATAGRYGSPQQTPAMTGFSVTPEASPAASSGSPQVSSRRPPH